MTTLITAAKETMLVVAYRNFELFSQVCQNQDAKAQFKRRSFLVPNLIPSIKYMKSSTFSNLGRPMN